MKLLSNPTSNAKLQKSGDYGYLTFGLSLAPADLSGLNVCPHASAGCRAACLFTAGRGVFASVRNARLRKTAWFFDDRDGFLDQLSKDINEAIRIADRQNMEPAFRLNVTSDINWESLQVLDEFPHVQFYDYTKNFSRMLRYCYGKLPENYHLTFSRSESNEVDAQRILQAGGNVAVVFKQVPAKWGGFVVIDGDKHDLRFTDPQRVVVGLKAKGDAKKDQTGFVV